MKKEKVEEKQVVKKNTSSKLEKKVSKTKKSKKIILVSYDGGGLRGYFPAYFLWKFQEEYKIDLFEVGDVFAGTSTGSILALASAFKMEKKALSKLYLEGRKLFKLKFFSYYVRCDSFLVKNRHLKHEIQKNIRATLKKRRYKNWTRFDKTFAGALKYTNKDFMIVTANVVDNSPVLFATKKFDVNHHSNKANYIQMVLASSAIPLVFTCIPDRRKYFKDHRVFFHDGMMSGNNNPTTLAVARLIAKGYKKEDIVIINFGNNGEKKGGELKVDALNEIRSSLDGARENDKKNIVYRFLNTITFRLYGVVRNSFVKFLSKVKDDVISDLNFKPAIPYTKSQYYVKKNYIRLALDTNEIYNPLLLGEDFYACSQQTYEKRKKELYNFIRKHI